MKKAQKTTDLTPSEWISLNHFLHEIKKIRSPCISVYYPYGKGAETISLLRETYRNPSFERIESKIEARIETLKKNPTSAGKFTRTLCIFGWLKNGRVMTAEIGTSRRLPFAYMASKRPFTKPFSDILRTHHDVLLVTIDQKTARVQHFHGNQVILESKLRIDLHGRHKKGGQSQGRFLRARQTKIHVFFKRVASKVRQMGSDSELVLLGGSGPAKTEFFDELDSEIAKKCRFVENLSFSTSKTNIEKKIIWHLSEHRKKHVSETLEKYEKLVKDGLTARKNSVILHALKIGAVDTLIVSSDYHSDSKFRNVVKMLEMAQNTSSAIEFATSRKVIRRLNLDDSVLAILRYKIR